MSNVSREGAEPGTEFLAVVRSSDGKMIVVGELEPFNASTLDRMSAKVRDNTVPGQPMHLLLFKGVVIGRCLKLDELSMAPSVGPQSNND